MSFKNPYPDVEIPNVSVMTSLRFHRRRGPGSVALVDPKSGSETTYRALIAQINAAAGALAARGIGVGDVVGILSPNVPAFATVFHGVLRAGATATTLNALFTANEIEKQLIDSKAKILITVSPLYEHAAEAAKRVGLGGEPHRSRR